VPLFASNYGRTGSGNGSTSWIAGALALPAAGLVWFGLIQLYYYIYQSIDIRSYHTSKYICDC